MVSQNNDGKYYEIAVDTAKEGAEVWSLNDWFKARVGDDGTPLVMRFYTQGQLNSFDGHQKPIIQGNVGAYSFDDQKQIVMAADAKVVSWTGDPSDMLPGGRARFRFPQQMFPTEGAFYGFVGYMDESNGRRLTGVNVWFRVLGGVAQMGKACDYYINDLDIALANTREKMRQAGIEFKVATDSALQDLRTKYQQEAQANQDASETTRASLLKLADAVGAIQAQIDAGNVVTLARHETDYNELRDNQTLLKDEVRNQLSKISFHPETFPTLAAIQTQYPKGTSNICVSMDNKHGFVWNGTTWEDVGVVLGDGLSNEEQQVLHNALYGKTIVYDAAASTPPYNDLNLLDDNTIVTYTTDITKISHAPENLITGSTLGATVITINYSSDSDGAGRVQFLITNSADQFVRVQWGSPATWSAWNRPLKKRDFVGIMAYPKDLKEGRYTDLNKLPVNTTVSYSISDEETSSIANYPSKVPGTVRTISCNIVDAAGEFQICVDRNNAVYHRILWGDPSYWTPWELESTETEKIKPSISLFQNIGIIGDSYASGELYVDSTYTDHYDISWGQILARKNGIKAINFSKGGLTTRDWLADDHGLSLINSSDPQDLYIIALGINDYQKLGDSYLGAENDVNTGANTFYGNYGKIISAIRAKAPQAKIVLSTMSYDTQGTAHNYNEAIKTLAQHFGLPVIEQNNDPLFTSDLYLNHMVGGHPTAPVYAAMANAFQRLIEKSMIDNLDYFMTYKQ